MYNFKVVITYNFNRASRTYWVHTLEEAYKLAGERYLDKTDYYCPEDVTSIHIECVE